MVAQGYRHWGGVRLKEDNDREKSEKRKTSKRIIEINLMTFRDSAKQEKVLRLENSCDLSA